MFASVLRTKIMENLNSGFMCRSHLVLDLVGVDSNHDNNGFIIAGSTKFPCSFLVNPKSWDNSRWALPFRFVRYAGNVHFV